jgi:hypothetical protein
LDANVGSALDTQSDLVVLRAGDDDTAPIAVPTNMEVIVLGTRRLEQLVGAGSLAALKHAFTPAGAGARPFGEAS